MKQIKVNRFLDESNELKEIIRDNQSVYIIGGCGIGKSYFVREYLMKTYITLNVNFLNVLNLQNFVDSYIDRNAIINSKGKESISINVKNLQYISDEALGNIDLVVVDEIQELWLSSNYRGETGDSLMNQLIRAKGKGCRIVVISGTPIGGVSIVEKLNLEVVEVIKTQIEDKDTYNYIFLQGLTKLNIGEFAKQQIEQDYTIVIKSDKDRKEIKQRLTQSGIDFEDIQSSDKLVSGSDYFCISWWSKSK